MIIENRQNAATNCRRYFMIVTTVPLTGGDDLLILIETRIL